jgi:glycosyltransferase involved in cell wall biosynthesis
MRESWKLSFMLPSNAAQWKCLFATGATFGSGGLGGIALNALKALQSEFSKWHLIFDDQGAPPLMDGELYPQTSQALNRWRKFYWPRFRVGRLLEYQEREFGEKVLNAVQMIRPDAIYIFTQIALETLSWARNQGIQTILDNPNGHIRNFRAIYEQESARWGLSSYTGHPTLLMQDRVEEEYAQADRIRVSSLWSKRIMVQYGVEAEKISVITQPVDLRRFFLAPEPKPATGPLRICYVGSLDLRKGFVYLLDAMRMIGSHLFSLEIVGSTGSRELKYFFRKKSQGLNIQMYYGDPVPAYQRAELFILPSLEDGFGLVVAEAMASGLPVIVTEQCGAADWVVPGENGWIVQAARVESLAEALQQALEHRQHLSEMGRWARLQAETHSHEAVGKLLQEWFFATLGNGAIKFSRDT